MRRSLVNLGLVLCLIVLCGCQAIPLFSKSHFHEADGQHPVMEVLCVWEPAEGRGVDNAPCRGFGGQILCFASGYKEPVKVRGDVRVYVFDNQGVNGDTSLPIHQFDFTADAWNTFLKPSSLGPSYQVFIPYTRKGMEEANCTLRVRLTPEGGLPVYSRMATVALAGHKSDKKSPANDSVVPISHDQKSDIGQGITTADFSEIARSTQLAPESLPPSTTPGISMAMHQDGALHTQRLMSSLRQAAEEASQVSQSEPPERLPGTHSLTLKPLTRSTPDREKSEAAGSGDLTQAPPGETRRLNGTTATKRRHPLEDLDAE